MRLENFKVNQIQKEISSIRDTCSYLYQRYQYVTDKLSQLSRSSSLRGQESRKASRFQVLSLIGNDQSFLIYALPSIDKARKLEQEANQTAKEYRNEKKKIERLQKQLKRIQTSTTEENEEDFFPVSSIQWRAVQIIKRKQEKIKDLNQELEELYEKDKFVRQRYSHFVEEEDYRLGEYKQKPNRTRRKNLQSVQIILKRLSYDLDEIQLGIDDLKADIIDHTLRLEKLQNRLKLLQQRDIATKH